MSVKKYYKKKLVNENIKVEYSSEEDMVSIRIDRKLNNGAFLGSDYLKIHPTYIEPLYKLLKEVTLEAKPTQNDGEAK